jgi:hypothetical protein
MNTLFATSASPVRRMVLAILLALILVPLMLTGAAHTAQAACTSQIVSTTEVNTAEHQTVSISGQCLGTNNAYGAKDSHFFYIHVYNGSQPWNACYIGDLVTCSISRWVQNEIVFQGFGGYYDRGYALYPGEELLIEELNPQNWGQWSRCIVIVDQVSNDCLGGTA